MPGAMRLEDVVDPPPAARTARGSRVEKGLLVAIAAMALLVAVAFVAPRIPRFFGPTDDGGGRIQAAKQQIALLQNQIESYRMNSGSFPTTEQGLSVLRVGDVPPDPWGQPYVYASDGDHYDLFSAGYDGVADTEDDVRP